jgi:hypothetical protein
MYDKNEGAMVHVNVRLPQHVVDYFKQFPNYTKAIRDALEQHVREATADTEETST